MNAKDLIMDAVLVIGAGFSAVTVMGKATTYMYGKQSEEARRQEEAASYGIAYNVAAKKAAALLGRDLSQEQAARIGSGVHYALALGWVPVYMVARRRFGMNPFGAGAATGLSMSVLVDELGNPLLGLTPPPQKYPLVSHLRGVAGHLVYGLSVAGFVEAGMRVGRRR